jgi:hypothetical protein
MERERQRDREIETDSFIHAMLYLHLVECSCLVVFTCERSFAYMQWICVVVVDCYFM